MQDRRELLRVNETLSDAASDISEGIEYLCYADESMLNRVDVTLQQELRKIIEDLRTSVARILSLAEKTRR